MLGNVLLTVLLLTIAQILRIYLLNLIAKPYFVIGIRDAMFMNAIGFLFNVISPLRIGEIFRFVFLKLRIETSSPIILSVLLLERIFDIFAITFLSFLFLGFSKSLSVVVLVFLVAFSILKINFLKFYRGDLQIKSNFSTYVYLIKKFYENLTWKNLIKIAITNALIWILYSISILILQDANSNLFKDWLRWNISPYRGIDSFFSTSDEYYGVNIYFVLPILLVGLFVSLLPHVNLFFLDWLKGGSSNFSRVGSYKSKFDYVKKVEFNYILKSPLKVYRDNQFLKETGIQVYEGGSGALIYSERDSNYIKKVGFGLQKERLIGQYAFMRENYVRWNFPNVKNGAEINHGFAYQIQKIVNAVRVDEFLRSKDITEIQIKKCMANIYKFIETKDPLPQKRSQINLKKITFDELWEIKVNQNLSDLRVLAPEFFEVPSFNINGIDLDSLECMALKIKKIADRLLFQTNTSQVHGDCTLSNLFISDLNDEIISIDPNPVSQLNNTSLDHGKVLQSIWANYENLMISAILLEQRLNSIKFSEEKIAGYTVALNWYQNELKNSGSNNFVESQIMCFVHLIRLLPYRVSSDRSKSAIFFGKSLEIGQQIIDEHEQ
jgi:hypothetical protein